MGELRNRNSDKGTLAELFGQIVSKILLKPFVIFTFGAIVGWHISFFFNGRNNDWLENIQLQLSVKDEKRTIELEYMKQQMQECQHSNNHIVDEKNRIVESYKDEINSSNKKMSDCQNRIEHFTVDHLTVVNQCGETSRNVVQESSTTSENIFFKLTVLVMNAFLAMLFMVGIEKSLEQKLDVAFTLLWCCLTVIIHSLNTSVVSLSILVILFIIVALMHG